MRIYISLLIALITCISFNAQVVINEVIFGPAQTIELKNIGSTNVDVDTLWLCSFPTYTQIQNMTIVSGNTSLAPEEILVVSGHVYSADDDELGLYMINGFGSSENILDYVEWGSTGHARSTVAAAAGIWSTGDFVDGVIGAESLEYDGTGDMSMDWVVSSSNTQGEENSNADVPCDASGIVVGNQSICPGESATFQVILTGFAPWTITYSLNGMVQDPITTSDSPFAWSLSEPGTYNLVGVSDAICEGTAQGTAQVNLNEIPTAELVGPSTVCSTGGSLIVELTGFGPWEVEYQLDGAPQGTINFDEAQGLIPVTVPGFYNLTSVSDINCQGLVSGGLDVEFLIPTGGNLAFFEIDGFTEFTTCAADDVIEEIILYSSDQEGDSVVFVVITEDNEILYLLDEVSPGVAESFVLDFDGAGVYTAYQISYYGGIEGLETGSVFPVDVLGCYDLSNPVLINVLGPPDCETSIEEFSLIRLNAYPNPVENELFIDIPVLQDGLNYRVSDTSGRIVLRDTWKAGQQSLNVEVLPAGLYNIFFDREAEGGYLARFKK